MPGQKPTGNQALCSHWQACLFLGKSSPRLARAESTFPIESPPQPEAAYTAPPWLAGPRAQGREAKSLGRALPVHQCHAALTRQCALNSCSWLFRFSFMATRALRLWRMLRRKDQGQAITICFYKLRIKPHQDYKELLLKFLCFPQGCNGRATNGHYFHF